MFERNGIMLVGRVDDVERLENGNYRVWVAVGRAMLQTYGEAEVPAWALGERAVVSVEYRLYDGRPSWKHLGFSRVPASVGAGGKGA